jgi:chromosome segregation ATPase
MVEVIQLKIWVLLGIIGVLVPVLVFALNYMVKSITTRLDTLIEQNEQFGQDLAKHNEQLVNLKDKVRNHEDRLNQHSNRIREVEREVDKHKV